MKKIKMLLELMKFIKVILFNKNPKMTVKFTYKPKRILFRDARGRFVSKRSLINSLIIHPFIGI